ncbi:MAG: EFR1 family ferrodoxin [Methanobacteriaceae archaeon]|nr:EFR1 family ferrodoxin [Methanobacteriaceae archaeon]
MKSKHVQFFYFSGTGNTYLVVRKMQKVLEELGMEVQLRRIEESGPEDVDISKTIGVGFPVAILSTYPMVWDFIENLPMAQGTEIFMVDTLGGFSGGIVGPIRRKVKIRGYKPVGACEIVMPSNIFYIQDQRASTQKIEKGLGSADEYARRLVEGKTSWSRVPLISDFIYFISILSWKLTAWKIHQRYLKFKTHKEKCNQCGICADLCPTHNILMNDFPVSRGECNYCLRCVSFCPMGAIPCFFNYKGKTYRAAKAKELLEGK